MHNVDKYMGLAIQLALADMDKPHRRGKMHMAAVACSRRTIAAQTNVQIPGERHYEGHAERRVLRHFSDNESAELYVARVTRDGHIALAKPCERCMKAIHTKNIKRIYYTTQDGYSCINGSYGR